MKRNGRRSPPGRKEWRTTTGPQVSRERGEGGWVGGGSGGRRAWWRPLLLPGGVERRLPPLLLCCCAAAGSCCLARADRSRCVPPPRSAECGYACVLSQFHTNAKTQGEILPLPEALPKNLLLLPRAGSRSSPPRAAPYKAKHVIAGAACLLCSNGISQLGVQGSESIMAPQKRMQDEIHYGFDLSTNIVSYNTSFV